MQCTFYEHGIRCPLAAHGGSRCVIHNTDLNSLPRHEPTPIEHPPAITHATQPDNLSTPTPITHENPPKSWVKPTNTHESSEGPGSALSTQYLELVPQGVDPDWQCTEKNCRLCDRQKPRCHFVLPRTMALCGFRPLKDRPFCRNHDPKYREQHRVQSANGGRASARHPASALDQTQVRLSLADRAGIQAALHAVITLELLGQISSTRARNILRALAIAAHNFDASKFHPNQHDANDYMDSVKSLSALLSNVVEQAATIDAPPPPPPPIIVPDTADRDDTKALLRALTKLSKLR